MILHDSKHYRIEQCHNTPLAVALDRKEKQADGRVALINIGWFKCHAHALTAMQRDVEQWAKQQTKETTT